MKLSVLAASLVVAAPLSAQQENSLRDRIDALRAPEIVIEDPYADEIASDLAMISREEPALFPRDEAIAIFIGPDCAECDAARAEIDQIARRIGVGLSVLDISEPRNAALMERLTLDVVPSYAMPDRLIRGHMPGFVLERYLDGAP
jgi:hypothetical protein